MDQGLIHEAVQQLADELNQYYEGKEVELIIVLKGAYIFAADLCRLLQFEHSTHFVKFTSYEGFSANKVTCDVPLETDVEGKEILIIEDIIDTGNTMAHFLEDLRVDNPANIQICSFLLKEEALQHELPIPFVGKRIDTGFVIGYGMDFDERCRSLGAIYQKI